MERGGLLAACLALAMWSAGAWAMGDVGIDTGPVPEQVAAALDGPAQFAHLVLRSGDHRGRPFAVVDKAGAMLRVYRADGRLMGASPALLGRTVGDRMAPGVGQRTQTRQLRESDLTTPAGRFDSEPGHNLQGDAIVWIDYDAALAIHRLREGPSHAFRAQRLASPDLRDRRVSAGCVVVPGEFFDRVVAPTLGRSRGTVYVMPEDRHWTDADALGHLLPAVARAMEAAGEPGGPGGFIRQVAARR